MHTLQFTATIRNGAIEVPEEYRAQLGERVKVILINTAQETGPDMIDQLLQTPLPAADFKPMRRNEIYERLQ